MITDNLYRCFYVIFTMELAAVLLFPFVLILRLLLQNMPKKYTVWIWRLYFFRIICPIAISSPFSISGKFNRMYHRILDSLGLTIKEKQGVLTSWRSVFLSDIEVSLPYRLCTFVWLIGIVVILTMMYAQQKQIRKEVRRGEEQLDEKIYQSAVQVPLMMGVFRPRYYVPKQISAKQLRYLLAHFEAQSYRRSQWWRILGFVILVLHWFDPLLWWAYSLAKKDEEMACDDLALKNLKSSKLLTEGYSSGEQGAAGKQGSKKQLQKEKLQYAQNLINLAKEDIKIPFTISMIFESNLQKRSVRMLYYQPAVARQSLSAGLLLSIFFFFSFFLRPLQIAWNGGTWGLGANASGEVRVKDLPERESQVIATCQTVSPNGLKRVLNLIVKNGEKENGIYTGEFALELQGSQGESLYQQSLNPVFRDYGITEEDLHFSENIALNVGDYNNDGVQELLIGQQADWKTDETVRTQEALFPEEETVPQTEETLSPERENADLLDYRYLMMNIGEQSISIISDVIFAAAQKNQESVEASVEEGIDTLFYVPVPGGRNYYVWNQEEQKYSLEKLTQEMLNQYRAVSEGGMEVGVCETHSLSAAGQEVMEVETVSDTTGSPAIQAIRIGSENKQKQMDKLDGYFCALEWAVEEDASTGRYAVLTYNGRKAQTFVVYDVEEQTVYYAQEDGNEILARAFQQYNGNKISFAEGGVVLYSLQSHDKDILTVSFAANADGGVTVRGSYRYHMDDGGITDLSFSQSVGQENATAPSGTGQENESVSSETPSEKGKSTTLRRVAETEKPKSKKAKKSPAAENSAKPKKSAAPGSSAKPKKSAAPGNSARPKKTAKPKVSTQDREPNGPVGQDAPWSIDDWDRYLAENWGM